MNDDKNRSYWFKRRRYGYGWTPVSWQGWLVIIVFIVIVVSGSVVLGDTPRNTLSSEALIYVALLLIAVILLIFISSKKGPSPKWRWGVKANDNPDEDF